MRRDDRFAGPARSPRIANSMTPTRPSIARALAAPIACVRPFARAALCAAAFCTAVPGIAVAQSHETDRVPTLAVGLRLR